MCELTDTIVRVEVLPRKTNAGRSSNVVWAYIKLCLCCAVLCCDVLLAPLLRSLRLNISRREYFHPHLAQPDVLKHAIIVCLRYVLIQVLARLPEES
jgi:hypothetical protein